MDEIDRYIRSLSNEDLIKMVRVEFDQYTGDALQIARDELWRRGVPPDGEEPASEEQQAGCAGQGQPAKAFGSGDGSMLNAFIGSELQYQENYDAILDFVVSMSIRCGEYEGCKFVVKKMDRDNFILFTEQVLEGNRVIKGCVAVGKEELIRRIEEAGREKEFTSEEEEV